MTTSTSRISTIARIMSAFIDCLSLPNTIGMGPIKRRPALRPWLEPRDDRAARIIIATKARTNPKTISNNPKSFTDMAGNVIVCKILCRA